MKNKTRCISAYLDWDKRLLIIEGVQLNLINRIKLFFSSKPNLIMHLDKDIKISNEPIPKKYLKYSEDKIK